MMTAAVIGDIHGRADKLRSALSWLQRTGRHVVFLGDYINRGNDSFAVLQLLIDFSRSYEQDVTYLRGNHEASLLRLLDDGESEPFLLHGGLAAVKSYTRDRSSGVLERFRRSFPKEHYDFLSKTALYHEDGDWLLSHAGFDPASPERRDESAMVYGKHGVGLGEMSAAQSILQKPVVLGHYVQTSGRPYMRGGVYCIDTGCGTLSAGTLTVLLLPELLYEQF